MGFYDLSRKERSELVDRINRDISNDLLKGETGHILGYCSDEDTYIRKAAYRAFGTIFKSDPDGVRRQSVIKTLEKLMESGDEKVRQTAVNAAGEIGTVDFDSARDFLDRGLLDDHHTVRNAVIGSIKKMGEQNPKPTLTWAEQYLNHEDKEIRRQICHGIELRGRTHPQDVLPLLAGLQHDETARVRKTLIHVLGQISYKKGCLETVVEALNGWENKELVEKALEEIIDVHERYKNFAHLTQQEAIAYIDENFTG